MAPFPLIVTPALLSMTLLNPADSSSERLKPIPLDGFGSGIHHWRHIRDAGRFIQAMPGQPSYAPEQVREIAANILLFQRENGGWPKDFDMTAILTPEQRDAVLGTRAKTDTSYDNDNIHSQVEYLARAYAQAHDPAWRSACERGFDFLLKSQYPNGGFPQRYPDAKGFHAHITYNDGVMIGILSVLDDGGRSVPHFSWLDRGRRDRAREAVRRGIACILKCQIKVDGALTGWCQQHDEITYEARPGRTFERASICPQETTRIVRFLMRQDRPSPEILASADAAVAWLERVKLSGIRVDKVRAPRESFLRHDTDFDTMVVASPGARSIWARHYEIGSNRPIFAGRDGVKKYALADIERERRTGTPWYGAWPSRLVDHEYPNWRRRLDQKTPAEVEPARKSWPPEN